MCSPISDGSSKEGIHNENSITPIRLAIKSALVPAKRFGPRLDR
jgi:hypothetical protein